MQLKARSLVYLLQNKRRRYINIKDAKDVTDGAGKVIHKAVTVDYTTLPVLKIIFNDTIVYERSYVTNFAGKPMFMMKRVCLVTLIVQKILQR